MMSDITLGQLFALPTLLPGLTARAKLETLGTYDEFIDCLNAELDNVIDILEENPEIRHKDSEDRLTIEIAGLLRQAGFNATHDTKVGGHVDVCVRHKMGFLWLGEAKKHSSYAWLLKGFNQLCTRYASGTPRHNQGGLFIYLKSKNAPNVVKSWEKRLAAESLPEYSIANCPTRHPLAFFTSHTHQSSGMPYRVRHMAINLYFDPKDKK